MLNYGEYGGRFVPETLIPALDELEAGWRAALADDDFHAELHHLLTTYAGRPTPLTLAERFAPDKRLYLKREDLLHTGAHKLNNALGQAVLARRLGKQRIVAETGAGQHGVATATVCARFGFDCVVYMGAEDMRRQRAERRPHAPARRRGAPGGVRDEDAEGGDERGDPRLDHERRDDPLPDRLVRRARTRTRSSSRELQAVIGREAREQVLAAEGRLPDAVVACVGGGSNAIGIFSGFVDDERAAGRRRGGRRGRARHRSHRRCCTARARRCSPTTTARSLDAHSISAGSTTRASGRSTRTCATPAAREYVGATDDEALAASHRLARTEGISPRSSRAHALARALELDEELVVVCLSGRGDKDLAQLV